MYGFGAIAAAQALKRAKEERQEKLDSKAAKFDDLTPEELLDAQARFFMHDASTGEPVMRKDIIGFE